MTVEIKDSLVVCYIDGDRIEYMAIAVNHSSGTVPESVKIFPGGKEIKSTWILQDWYTQAAATKIADTLRRLPDEAKKKLLTSVPKGPIDLTGSRRPNEDDFGPTNRFPQGKLNAHDEGELKMAVLVEENVVKILFGKPIVWLGLPKKEALEFAEMVKNRAEEL